MIEQIKVPRWIGTTTNLPVKLYGFCDASENAYAAVIYCLQNNDKGERERPYLLISKTKVAPIKCKLTIPRLELCGALLLARLMAKVIKSLQISKITTHAFTDSNIVLTWIKAEPHRFKTFVSNRISEIHSLTNPADWNYIKSAENPADCASRGMEAEKLSNHSLWWNGPDWLTLKQNEWPTDNSEMKPEEIPDQKSKPVAIATMLINNNNPFSALFEKYSNLKKIQRIVSYCKRFINKKCKLVKADTTNTSETISPEEMQEALHHLIKGAQLEQYKDDIYNLRNNKPINKKSKLISLSPFLKDGLLRVGGRLHNSTAWSYDEKHPIIIPQSHPIVNLIIQEGHKTTMHGGTQLTLAHIRTKYWIINGRNLVRKYICKCIKCHRFSKVIQYQLMGNLPEARITPSRPFQKVGVDYAGPFSVRVSKGRGHKSYKGYLSIFVCMATKAVHIEVVSDLTTEAFIAAYNRFISRRGICTDIFCDNGTNFVGASKVMELNTLKTIEEAASNIITSSGDHGTKWHFIPPGTPHFGGLWEAAVKSVKYHLKRVIGEATLTFEELTTLTCQIEACLNSRPISPMTNDPTDPTFLTPGHFLIGESLKTQSEPNISEQKVSSLNRWKLIQKMKEDFWKKWSQDYLHQLQQRAKWTTKTPDLKVGQIVLVRDNNIPPSKWITGRITEIHPGQDGIVRVVTLRGPGRALIKRPITKLAPLPIDDSNDNIITKQKIETEKPNIEIKATTALSTSVNDKYNSRKRSQKEETLTREKKAPRLWLRNPVEEEVKQAARKMKILPQPQTNRRKIRPCFQSKLMLYTMIPLLSILGVCSSIINNSKFSITSLNATTGVYFENIGTAQLSHQQWTIVSYFNLSAMSLEAETYNAAINRMDKSCQEDNGWSQLRQICKPAIVQLKQLMLNIDHNNEIFQPTYTSTRPKRGLVNVVGTLTNQLFGILDQDDALRYDNEIKAIKNNEAHIYKLLKEQITITESTVNIMKRDWITVNKQLQEIDQQTASILSLVQKKENENLIVQRFITTWIHLSIEMTTFMSTQQQLIDVVTDIHHSKINTFILKPDQLKEELQKLHEIIPADATIYGENNMITLYQMMTAKVGQANNALIFEIKMPLLNNKVYQIIKPIAIPTKHKDMFAYINPSSELFLISLNRESYYAMSENELSACKTIKGTEYICVIHNVIQNTQNKPTSCEINLIVNKETDTESCDIRIITPRNMWIPTHDPSTWIFVAEREHTINIICNKEVTTTTLSGTGSITTHKACTITDGMITIHSIQNYVTRIEAFYQPTINISRLLIQAEDETLSITTNRTLTDGKNSDILTDLNQLSTNITHLKTSVQNRDQLNSHDVHHYTMLYGIIIIFTGLLIAYFCKSRKPRLTFPTSTSVPQPIPLPRRFLSTSVAPEDVQAREHNVNYSSIRPENITLTTHVCNN